MGEAELVEVMHVGEAEDNWGEEDDLGGSEGRAQGQGDGGGAEEEFFCYGTLQSSSQYGCSGETPTEREGERKERRGFVGG